MKKSLAFLITLFLFTLFFATPVFGGDIGSQVAKNYKIKNYSLAYSSDGKVTYENFGRNTTEDTVFELASNGKMIAAYIALKLVDEGKINPDDKIASWLESNLITKDKRMSDITLRQLLCHTAGFSPSFELGVDKKLYSNPGEKFCYSGVGYIYLQSVIENVSGMTLEEAATKYVFSPLGMKNSTFEKAKTITPYIKALSAALYAFALFILAFVILFLLALILGKITKNKLFSKKTALLVSYFLAGIINTIFLLFVFVSKVALLFWICFAVIGALLLILKNKKIFYWITPLCLAVILVCAFVIPISLPATNDLISKKANCAYTLKSSSRDMALFADELMRQYQKGNNTVNKMFSPGVEIDSNNSWGLGIAVEKSANGTTYWHSGINPGFQSLFVLYPEQNKFIVVLTNSDEGLSFAQKISRSFLNFDGQWEIKR